MLGRSPVVVPPVFLLRRVLELDGIIITDIPARIGDAPCAAVVESDDDIGRSGERDSVSIEFGRLDLHLVPDGGQVRPEVRIVAKNGTAAQGLLPADSPVIAAVIFLWLHFPHSDRLLIRKVEAIGRGRYFQMNAGGKEIRAPGYDGVDTVLDGRIELCKIFLAEEILRIGHLNIFVRAREVISHIFQEQGDLKIGPGLGLVVEQLVFQWQLAFLQVADIFVHAGRVGIAIFFGDAVLFYFRQCFLGAGYHAQSAHLAVEFHVTIIRARAQDLAQSSCGGMGLEFHLPEAEFRMQVSLDEAGVLRIAGHDMRNEAVIEIDLRLILEFRYGKRCAETLVHGIRILPATMLGAEELTERWHFPPLSIETKDQDDGEKKGNSKRNYSHTVLLG